MYGLTCDTKLTTGWRRLEGSMLILEGPLESRECQ